MSLISERGPERGRRDVPRLPAGVAECLAQIRQRLPLHFTTRGAFWALTVTFHAPETSQQAYRSGYSRRRSRGWAVTPSNGHAWGQIRRAGRRGCRLSIWSTPKHPEDHAKDISRFVRRCPIDSERAHMKHEFTLIVEGPIDDQATLDRLFESGCDDATFSTSNGIGFADFHREADSFSRALTSAIGAVEGVQGLRVTGVTPIGLPRAS